MHILSSGICGYVIYSMTNQQHSIQSISHAMLLDQYIDIFHSFDMRKLNNSNSLLSKIMIQL